VIGHRGAAATHPENTLSSIRAAHDAGARWVEFDVRLAADGAPVVIHDPTLDRIARRKARVAALTSTALAAFDVPTLGQVLRLCAEIGLGANVEMKDCGRRNTRWPAPWRRKSAVWPNHCPCWSPASARPCCAR
jgi:glycerophosphoryl diester phosphodiesterase